MNYNEALEYLQGLTKFGINLGLGRINELLDRLGNPHEKLKVIHVGGTNGKGSTCAMLSSILKTAGCKVGTFTSPHLHSYTERYRLNGKEIHPGDVVALINRLRPHLESMVKEGFEHPTEFEVSTAMAFCYFLDQQVDLLVLEVGLGGAIDSTNVVSKPLVSVITNVAMDHMDYLGHTIKDIAAVKAGLIKKGVPVVTAARNNEALEVIRQVASINNAPLVEVSREVTWQRTGSLNARGQQFTITGSRGSYKDLWLPLLGRHQLENAAVAIAVLELLIEAGYEIKIEHIKKGLATTSWPARLEVLGEEPLIILDGAHNYEGAKSLRQALDEYFPSRQIIMVLGMLADKERARVVNKLVPGARTVIVTRPNNPRAGNWQQLAEEVRPLVKDTRIVENIKEAIEQALAIANPAGLVCITGSLYMVAEAREFITKFRSHDFNHHRATEGTEEKINFSPSTYKSGK